jgi:hypothetical protein
MNSTKMPIRSITEVASWDSKCEQAVNKFYAVMKFMSRKPRPGSEQVELPKRFEWREIQAGQSFQTNDQVRKEIYKTWVGSPS